MRSNARARLSRPLAAALIAATAVVVAISWAALTDAAGAQSGTDGEAPLVASTESSTIPRFTTTIPSADQSSALGAGDEIGATVSIIDGAILTTSPVALIGTATSPLGVQSVRLELRDLASGGLIDLAGLPASSSTEVDLLQPGADGASWVGTLALPDGSYEVNVQVLDSAGRTSSFDRPVRFEISAAGALGLGSSDQDSIPRLTTTSVLGSALSPTTTSASLGSLSSSGADAMADAADRGTADAERGVDAVDAAVDGPSDAMEELGLDLSPSDGSRWRVWLVVLGSVLFVILVLLGIMVLLFARTRVS